MWKDFFYYSKAERKGIAVLVLLVAALGVRLLFFPTEKGKREDEKKEATFEKEYRQFADATRPKHKEHSRAARRTAGTETPAITPVPFDPNTADSLTLAGMGLPTRVTRNVLRYRAKQGRFRQPQDFRKIYGLTDELYQQLLPYIRIAPAPAPPKHTTLTEYAPDVRTESPPRKYPPGTRVELNRADTAELQRIPGIGSVLARRIVDYRNRLGAYCRIEQLGEIRLKAEKLRPWFSIDTTLVRPININRASIRQMTRHPYFNFYQAKAVYEHRRKKGDIRTLKELSLYEEFAPADLERLQPYVCFE